MIPTVVDESTANTMSVPTLGATEMEHEYLPVLKNLISLFDGQLARRITTLSIPVGSLSKVNCGCMFSN